MKNNNSKITPKGFDSYEVYRDKQILINLLIPKKEKESFFDRHLGKIFILILVGLIIYKIKTGDFSIEIEHINTTRK